MESISQRAEMPVEVRLLTVEFSQTPRKRGPHWEVVLYLAVSTKQQAASSNCIHVYKRVIRSSDKEY